MNNSKPFNLDKSAMQGTNLNPSFDDLINQDTILNHIDGLQKTVEAEQKAKQNPFPG